ncbi:hypothetical protein EJB05_25723, partial [Eragrostis curvula]
MDLVTRATGSLASKLDELLKEEGILQKGVRKQVESLSRELESIHSAICKVADSPLDELDPQVRIWAGELKEASDDMVSSVNNFLKPKECCELADLDRMKHLLEKMGSLFNKGKALDEIAITIEDMENQLQEVTKRRGKSKVDDAVVTVSTTDPSLSALGTEESQLIGVREPRDALIKKLSVAGDDASDKKMKILSIVGSEGLGKTSLAKEVFDQVKPKFDCAAFVQVGQNPDMQKVFRDILTGLGKEKSTVPMMLDLMQLIWLLRKCLINKRFFVVVDDIRDLKAWDIINCALIENSNGSAVLTTTAHNIVVTEFVGDIYKLQHLSPADSSILFWKKLFDYGINYLPADLASITEKLIATCGGIPSAIIDTVELLISKASAVKDWQAFYEEKRMLALPPHLMPCLLYLSMFQKGYEICGERLVWGWIAEGFVQETEGRSLKEVGESYLNELIMGKMIEAVEVDVSGKALSCRAYDSVHDFIISKSTEDKFVTIFDGSQGRPLPDTVLRLSIQGDNVASSLPQVRLSHLRSLVVSGDVMPSISVFPLLRVLDLRDCDSLLDEHLKGIENLVSLKSLFIGGKCITGLPNEIENLTSLQTLDLSESGVNELPKSVFELKQLERLCVSSHMKIPDGIGKMEGLLELGDINVTKPELLNELHHLTNLKILRIAIWSWDDSLKSSAKPLADNLCSLVKVRQNIQSLSILTSCSLDFMDHLDAQWAPPSLKKLEIRYGVLIKLSGWILSLCDLSSLSIELHKLSRDMINMLGKLDNLSFLSLTIKHPQQAEFVTDYDDGFKNLECLQFASNAMTKMFAPESKAIKKLRRVKLLFQASRTKDINKDFSFGFEHLPFLEHARVEIICFNTSHRVVEEAEAAIWKAVFKDPIRRPNLEIRRTHQECIDGSGSGPL